MTADEAREALRQIHNKDGLGWNICIVCREKWPCDPSQDIWTEEDLERFARIGRVSR